MARHPSLTLDYKTLVFNTLKEKYIYVLLGIAVTGSLFLTVLSFFIPLHHLLPGGDVENNPDHSAVLSNESSQYTVREGDYLWNIAEQTYGSGFNAFDIAAANKLSEPYLLNAGQILILPKVKSKIPTQGEVTDSAASTNVRAKTETYVVQPGDDLGIISQKVYGFREGWERIAAANNLANPHLIEINEVLVIPR